MSGLFAASTRIAAIPPEFWVWGAVTCLFAAALGFVAGVLYQRNAVKRTLERAQKHVSKLYSLVVQSLDHAQEACSVLEKVPGLQLSSRQTDGLHGKRNELQEVVSNIVQRQSERLTAVAKKREENAKLVAEQLASGWMREPMDVTTGIPDRSAFDANLQKMLDFGARAESESGLLLVRIDKFEQHRSRYGTAGVEKFLKTLSSIICRSLREDDIVCRFHRDTFGVLFVNVDADGGKALSATLRNSIRGYQFRTTETGPEVLVTASFGYARCLPHDSAELVLNRADSALSRSSRRGRNQLHVHDGDELTFCATT